MSILVKPLKDGASVPKDIPYMVFPSALTEKSWKFEETESPL